MKMKGTVVHLDFENEAFGLLDESGKKYLPINMPEQLKRNGAKVTVRFRMADVVTAVMWGQPIYIYSFETI
jgi:hypothetical protein